MTERRGGADGRRVEPEGPSDAGEERALELAHRVFESAARGPTRELCAYLDAGVPVDSTDSEGQCLLLLASYHGHEAGVRALLERGADPDRVDGRGQTPLAAAVVRGHRELVDLLVTAGADPLLGEPDALEAARFFHRDDLLELMGLTGDELRGT